MVRTMIASAFCASCAKDTASLMAHDSAMPRKQRMADREPPIHFLQQWRRHRSLTQQKLADRAGLSHSTISRLENGQTNLTRATAALLAAALMIDIADLFRDPGDPHGVWSLARNLTKLPPDQRRMVETIINTFLKECNGSP